MLQKILLLIILKNRIKRKSNIFSVDFNLIHTNDILDRHKYLMKKYDAKAMFGLIKKMLIVTLSNIINGSNHAKCIPLSNQKCMFQSTLINLHPNEYS